MAKTIIITATAMPALKPGFWVTEREAEVVVAEAGEPVALLDWEVWDVVEGAFA